MSGLTSFVLDHGRRRIEEFILMHQEILRGIGRLVSRGVRFTEGGPRQFTSSRAMPALGRRVTLSYPIPEREVHELELSSNMVGSALLPAVPLFVPRAFRSAVRLLSQPFTRPFPTPLCFAAQSFVSTRAVPSTASRGTRAAKSAWHAHGSIWAAIRIPNIYLLPAPARRHANPNQPNSQSISTLGAAIVARGCRERAEVQHIVFFVFSFFSFGLLTRETWQVAIPF